MGLVRAVTNAASRAWFVFEQGTFHFLAPMVVLLVLHKTLASELSAVALLAPPGLGWIATIFLAATWPGLFDPWQPVFPLNWTLPTVQCCASMIGAYVIQGWFPLAWSPSDPPIARWDALWTRLDWLAIVWAGHVLVLTGHYRLLARKSKPEEARP
ncbi:MAG: hypothetical protein KF884_07905 [Fimbriimonadaceae bacterium]|nr:hypothetical protein [Fimbriimonadaceae bacterium]QYK57474.1 MAG: hypothetical protein KF884_07905 [Fimbriimonadaceae bacterium]